MEPLNLDPNGNPMPVFNPGDQSITANQAINVDGSAASAFSVVLSTTERTTVQIVASADCTYLVSSAAAPEALATSSQLPAGLHHMIIPAGCRIAVLGGKLNITKHVG